MTQREILNFTFFIILKIKNIFQYHTVILTKKVHSMFQTTIIKLQNITIFHIINLSTLIHTNHHFLGGKFCDIPF